MVEVSSQYRQGIMPDTSSLNQYDPVVGKVEEMLPIFDAADFTEPRRHFISNDIRDACHEFGFFYIDLGADRQQAINKTLTEMQRFFSIPDEDPCKQNVKQGIDESGWVPRFTEPAYQPGTVSSLEAFDCDRNDIDGTADRSVWPELPGFQDAVTLCWSSYADLANGVLDVLGRAAGLSPDFFVTQCSSQELNTMRLLHYAAGSAQDEKSSVGISAHTDFECITLIYQDAPGLELTEPSGDWLDAPIAGGRIVVLLGDILERWTNGFFKATGHRVRETDEQRFSIVMFIAANDNLQIGPLSKFVSASSPALYGSIGQARHIENEIRRSRENAAKVDQD
jgi:isopenicillin N synthase-like dioxygenase